MWEAIEVDCICGKILVVPFKEAARGRGKYCSKKCMNTARSRSHTAEFIVRNRAGELRELAKDYALSIAAQFMGHDRKVIRKAADILGISFPRQSKPNLKGGGIYGRK